MEEAWQELLVRVQNLSKGFIVLNLNYFPTTLLVEVFSTFSAALVQCCYTIALSSCLFALVCSCFLYCFNDIFVYRLFFFWVRLHLVLCTFQGILPEGTPIPCADIAKECCSTCHKKAMSQMKPYLDRKFSFVKPFDLVHC